tara:strand:- start:675 stop:1097 length:423 start_codon:yes stop_codon:yes gene_type:complete
MKLPINLFKKFIILFPSGNTKIRNYILTMNASRSSNAVGIFNTKRAKFLAQRYNLDLNDKSCYGVSSDKFVKYDDIMFIVDNLWLTHFVEDAETPINNYTWVEYNNIYNKLRDKWPYVFNYYDNVHEEETIRPIDRGLLG